MINFLLRIHLNTFLKNVFSRFLIILQQFRIKDYNNGLRARFLVPAHQLQRDLAIPPNGLSSYMVSRVGSLVRNTTKSFTDRTTTTLHKYCQMQHEYMNKIPSQRNRAKKNSTRKESNKTENAFQCLTARFWCAKRRTRIWRKF